MRQEDPAYHPRFSIGMGGNQLKTHYDDHKNKEITSLKISLEPVRPVWIQVSPPSI